MTRLIIYSIATGLILRTVHCPSALASAQLASGEAYLPDPTGTISDATHRVEQGQFVKIVPPPAPIQLPPTADALRAILIRWAQSHLDATARAWGYDDIRSACIYLGDPYPRFAAEALALRDWRSAVWAYLDAASTSPIPSPMPTRDEFIALLPAKPERPTV